MADVIRAALDAHQLGWVEGRRACIACVWMPLDGSLLDFAEHQAEVARAAVLEVVARVLAAHQEDGDGCTGCDWYDGPGGRSPRTRGDHLQALIAAALAGEG